MKAIFASKLYKASPRKDKIKAALNNPINSELVGQLAEYLDEEYRPEPKMDLPDMPEMHDRDDAPDWPNSGSAPSGRTGSLGGGRSYSGDGMNYEDDLDVEDDLEIDDDSISEIGEPNEGADSEEMIDDLDDGEDIETSTDIDNSVDPVDSFNDDDVIGLRNLLENDVATCGVDRILRREDEVWIYYEDTINLNKIMSSVIEKIESSKWSNLEFNRLARSSNAIVFQIREK